MPETPIWKHFAALIYDVFPVIGLLLVTSMIVLLIRNGVEVERSSIWFTSLLLVEVALYFIYSWKIGGQTLGMRAWKIKIFPKQNTQQQLTWPQASARFFIGVLSTLMLGSGLFWKVVSNKKQSWMDIISHSETKYTT